MTGYFHRSPFRTEPMVQVPRAIGEAVDASEGDETETADEEQPKPTNEVERSILNDQIEVLQPRRPLSVQPTTPVRQVLQFLVENDIGCVLVEDDGKPVGIFSERDALIKLNCDADRLGDHPVSEFMTPHPESLEMSAKIAFAVQRMDLGGFRHVPIIDDRKHLTGIISVRDILKYLTERISATEKA